MTTLRASLSQIFFSGPFSALREKPEERKPSALETAKEAFENNKLIAASHAVYELGNLVTRYPYLAPVTMDLALQLALHAQNAAQKDAIAATTETRLTVVGIKAFASAFEALPVPDTRALLNGGSFFANVFVPLSDKILKNYKNDPNPTSARIWLKTGLRLAEKGLNQAWPELAEPPLDLVPFDYAPARNAKIPTKNEVLAYNLP